VSILTFSEKLVLNDYLTDACMISEVWKQYCIFDIITPVCKN